MVGVRELLNRNIRREHNSHRYGREEKIYSEPHIAVTERHCMDPLREEDTGDHKALRPAEPTS